VLVVEDVITTGGQVVLSTEELRSRGALVGTVLCVIDRRARGSNGADKLGEASISMRSLFTLDEILGTSGD
jgi:orotate phosphoribosyltransferase